ncbi:MAG: gliding motility-associated C-terminal domain-containing protein [Bacteroidales bacterium]|nr:gliding motility-associated C-terminal domain-containing protein [Bacteroidales bacterium]
MKKLFFTVLALFCALGLSGTANAQLGSDTACVGLKNPTNFTMTGSHQELWTGYTGSKGSVASTCTSEGATFSTTVEASQLESINNGDGCAISLTNSQTRTLSRDIHNQLDHQRQFVIKGPGSDPDTYNHLSYLPPDPTFTSSIRLGNYCGNHGGEKLTYDLYIQPDNALLTIWYALSLQNGQHSAAENPEFTIVVQKQNGSNWSLLAGDTLCYLRPTPVNTTPDTSFRVGSTGAVMASGTAYGTNLYLPWRKVMINLFDYMYQKVRIKITAGDCSMSAHYAMAYIAGDCQPMKLRANGCAAGESNEVARINAPKGASNYAWYRSKTGKLNGEARNNESNYVLISGQNADSLNCFVEQFIHQTSGDTLTQNTFMCKMTTKMNETKPVISTIFTDVGNTKPAIVVDSVLNCNAGITLINRSYTPYAPADSNNVDTNATVWEFYSSSAPTPQTLVGTYTGARSTHTYPTGNNNYSVKIRTAAYDSTCWNEKTIPIRTVKSPVPQVLVERNNLCKGDTITINDLTYGSQYHRWTLSYPDTTYITPMPVTQISFDTTTLITMRTRSSAHFAADTTGDGIVEDVYCYSDTSFTIRVQEYPKLTVSGDTIVCNGDQSNVTVSCNNVPVESYNWYQILNGTTPVVENNNQLQTYITQDRRYYVKVLSTYGCESWDSINLYLVKPSLEVDRDKICTGDTATLTAGRAAYFEWTSNPPDPALNAMMYDSVIKVSPDVTTVYSVVGHGTNDCGATALTQKITVYPYPIMQVQLTPDYIDSENPSVQFSDQSEYGTTSLWNFGNGNTSTIRTVVFTFTDLSQDSLLISLVTGNAIGCTSDTSFYVPVGIFAVWFPNAFTPKLETNNIFKPFTANTLEDYELHIFDRGGNQVFSTTNVEEGWDGTYKGHECKQGSYVYIATYRRQGVERLMSQKGTLTLIK